MKVKTISELKEKIQNSDELAQQLKNNPQAFIDSLEDPIKDKNIFRTVLFIVGAVLLLTIILSAWITLSSDPPGTVKVPEYLISIMSTALGAIVGLLVPNNK